MQRARKAQSTRVGAIEDAKSSMWQVPETRDLFGEMGLFLPILRLVSWPWPQEWAPANGADWELFLPALPRNKTESLPLGSRVPICILGPIEDPLFSPV